MQAVLGINNGVPGTIVIFSQKYICKLRSQKLTYIRLLLLNMKNISNTTSSVIERHFDHYFRLLLDRERKRLSSQLNSKAYNNEIEFKQDLENKISHLQGTIHIVNLLCIITDEDAVTRNKTLQNEKHNLTCLCENHFGTTPKKEVTPKFDYKSLIQKQN